MAINWITAFKLIPWADVVEAVPTVVRSAKGLWSRAQKDGAQTSASNGHGDAEVNSVSDLSARVAQLEAGQLEASALINTLAEQNVQLIAALDILRNRIKVLCACCVLLALGGVALWLG